jgi:hypothetical protein
MQQSMCTSPTGLHCIEFSRKDNHSCHPLWASRAADGPGAAVASARAWLAACAQDESGLFFFLVCGWHTELSFFVAALCSCLVLCALCFVLCALCFVLCAQNHIFWSKLAALCSCFVLCAWPCATKRPDFCEQERLPSAALVICSVRMLCASCFVLGERGPKHPISTNHEHGAQSTKHKA